MRTVFDGSRAHGYLHSSIAKERTVEEAMTELCCNAVCSLLVLGQGSWKVSMNVGNREAFRGR